VSSWGILSCLVFLGVLCALRGESCFFCGIVPSVEGIGRQSKALN
jgi:hypothetical protein